MSKWWLFLIVVSLALASCSPQALAGVDPTPVSSQPAEGAVEAPVEENTQAAPGEPQVLTRAITSEPNGLDPQGTVTSGQNVLLPYLFDTLVFRNADNTFSPYLAESWTFTPDGKQATFVLHKGIRFHDGTPLDAAAVKFTFERLQQQGERSVLASVVSVIASIEVVDDVTVQFNFKEASSTFLSSISLPYAGIVSPAAVQAEGDGFSLKPVGSGPFMFESWEPGVAVTLVKNPDYAWAPPVVENRGAPHVDRLAFKVIPDVTQQVSAFQAGEVDMLFINQPSHLARLRQDSNTEIHDATLNAVVYLGFNVRRAPYDDPKVRAALSHLVNKEEVLQAAAGGNGQVAFAPLAPTLPGFDPSLKEYEYGYDVEKAKALLVEAGYSQADGGSWSKDGQPLAVSLLTSTRPPNQAIATVLQSQFKAAGIDMTINQLDSTAAQEAASKGDFDLLLWRYDWNDADVLRIYLSSSRIGRTNRNFYSNPRVDELLEKAAHEMDDAARNALYLEAQQIILQDAPWQPLYIPTDFMAIRKEVGGVVMGPMGRVLLNDAVRK